MRGGDVALAKCWVGGHRGPVCHPDGACRRVDGIAAGTITAEMGEPEADGRAGALAAFAQGLRPILAQADVEGFRRYLGRWDEVIGDTSVLAVQSDAEVRRTMAEMMRRPRQFGLPAWGPTDITQAIEAPPEVPSVEMVGERGVEPTDPPMAIYQEVALFGGGVAADGRRGMVGEPSVAWRQSDFVTGTTVEARGRVPRVVPALRADPASRTRSRTPPGFRQLDLPLGQGD